MQDQSSKFNPEIQSIIRYLRLFGFCRSMQQRTDGDPVLPIKMLAKTGFWWVFYFFGITELFLFSISVNNLFAKILDDPFLMYLY